MRRGSVPGLQFQEAGHGYFQRAFLALVLQGRLLFPGLPATPRSVIPVPQGLPPGTAGPGMSPFSLTHPFSASPTLGFLKWVEAFLSPWSSQQTQTPLSRGGQIWEMRLTWGACTVAIQPGLTTL